MNRVLPGLFVGNYRDSKDVCQLDRHKISHIVAIHDAARRIHSDKEYLCIMASDSPNQNLSQYFPACNDFIHAARIQGSHSNVLIHCLAGMSRSVTVAIAYLMSITTLRWDEALKAVRGARAVSNPNSGFQKQLQEYEATKLFEERRRMAEKYPGTTYLTSDVEHCRRLISSYNNLLISRAICEVRCHSALICPSGTCRTTYGSPRLGRQKSVESTSIQAATTSSSGNASLRGAILESSRDSPSGSPQASPKSWERHYGCWKNHFRQRQSSTGSAPGSAPGSPVLFRASKGQRSDSMTSIAASNTSLNSLPHHLSERDQFGGSGVISGSRSCPNSPRRMPKKLPRTGSQRSDINRDLGGNSSASSLRYHHTAGSSKSTPSVWAVSQQPVQSTCSRFNSHNSAASISLAHSSVVGSNTRWVMKRSAYRYTMDNS